MIPVLWVTHVYPRHPSDMPGSFLHRLARELPARGYTPHVLAPSSAGVPSSETLDGVLIRRFASVRDSGAVAYTGQMHAAALRHPIAFARFLIAMRAAVHDAIVEWSPTLVHAHWWFPGGWAAIQELVRSPELPGVLSVHGTDVRLLEGIRVARPAARRVFGCMSCVLPVSSFLADTVLRLGIGAGRVEILPMPADGTIFTPGAAVRSSDFVLAARLVPQKRADLAIRGLAHARSQGVEGRLHIVGDGPARGGLVDLTRRLGCDSAVTFHGTLSPTSVAQLVRSACAAVLPSEREGYGLVLVEAALCETPGIGARSGAIPETVVPGESGWLVDEGDWKGIGNAMIEAIRRPQQREAFGREARRRALLRTASHSADRLASIYREVALGRSNRLGSHGRE